MGVEVIGQTLINQNWLDWARITLGQLCSIVLFPGVFIGAKVPRESFLAPGTVERITDGREGRDGLEEVRVFKTNSESTYKKIMIEDIVEIKLQSQFRYIQLSSDLI